MKVSAETTKCQKQERSSYEGKSVHIAAEGGLAYTKSKHKRTKCQKQERSSYERKSVHIAAEGGLAYTTEQK